MAATLKTTFAGVSMPNPFMLSSAPPTTNCEMVARSFDAGWGGAVLKTLAYNLNLVQNVNPRITAYRVGKSIQGFTNFELGSPTPIGKWLEGSRWLKDRFPEHAVFISLLHTEGLIEEQWREVVRAFNDTGIDGYELNFSCTHGMAEGGGGAQVGSREESIKMVTRWVREETKLRVMPKLPAMVPDLPGKARAAKEAGADAIAAINTLNSLPGIDLHTFVPYPSVGGNSAFQGLSGRAIKPVALRSVAQIAGAVDLPVSGMGGIYTWEDAAEFILAGARSLQVCSSVMEYGYDIVSKMKSGLLDYMDEMGFETIDDFAGKALAHIAPHRELPRRYRLYAKADGEKCIGCGRCVHSCADSAYGAIALADGHACVDPAKCDGCGLCSQICPVGAISMIRR